MKDQKGFNRHRLYYILINTGMLLALGYFAIIYASGIDVFRFGAGHIVNNPIYEPSGMQFVVIGLLAVPVFGTFSLIGFFIDNKALHMRKFQFVLPVLYAILEIIPILDGTSQCIRLGFWLSVLCFFIALLNFIIHMAEIQSLKSVDKRAEVF